MKVTRYVKPFGGRLSQMKNAERVAWLAMSKAEQIAANAKAANAKASKCQK